MTGPNFPQPEPLDSSLLDLDATIPNDKKYAKYLKRLENMDGQVGYEQPAHLVVREAGHGAVAAQVEVVDPPVNSSEDAISRQTAQVASGAGTPYEISLSRQLGAATVEPAEAEPENETLIETPEATDESADDSMEKHKKIVGEVFEDLKSAQNAMDVLSGTLSDVYNGESNTLDLLQTINTRLNSVLDRAEVLRQNPGHDGLRQEAVTSCITLMADYDQLKKRTQQVHSRNDEALRSTDKPAGAAIGKLQMLAEKLVSARLGEGNNDQLTEAVHSTYAEVAQLRDVVLRTLSDNLISGNETRIVHAGLTALEETLRGGNPQDIDMLVQRMQNVRRMFGVYIDDQTLALDKISSVKRTVHRLDGELTQVLQ